MEDIIVATAYTILADFLKTSKVDKCHGIDHAWKVYEHACIAIQLENLSPSERAAIVLAALLHDADDRKFFPKSVDFQNARSICRDVAPELEILVIRMISRVSCSKNGNRSDPTPWLLIPRWCDRIEALGEMGIWRCYVYSMENQRPMMVPEDRLPTSREHLKELANPERFEIYLKSKGTCSASFIGHFYDKLLHLAVPTGNRYLDEKLAEGHEVLVQFLLKFNPAEPEETLGPIVAKFEGQ